MPKNEVSTVVDQAGLTQPGDNMNARITDTGRQVLTIEKDEGTEKYSATRYTTTGTIVETKTTKVKNNNRK
jgi:hypothetical protein